LPTQIRRKLKDLDEGSDNIYEAYTEHFSNEELSVVDGVDAFATQGYRTLAFAMRVIENVPGLDEVFLANEIERDL